MNKFQGKLWMILVLLGMGFTQAHAQKIGHVNRQVLLEAMPQLKQVNAVLDSIGRQKDAYYQRLVLRFQQEQQAYQEDVASLGEAERKDIAEGLQSQRDRITSYQQEAQNDLMQKQNELLQPVIDILNKTIAEVAKENGFDYVLDSEVLIHFPNGSDITDLVRKKLNLPAAVMPVTGK